LGVPRTMDARNHGRLLQRPQPRAADLRFRPCVQRPLAERFHASHDRTGAERRGIAGSRPDGDRNRRARRPRRPRERGRSSSRRVGGTGKRAMNDILRLARPDILALEPYQHAAWAPSLERLHANEMPWRAAGDQTAAGLNRYPQPQPAELIRHLATLYSVAPQNVLAGRGSDEAIDLLVRAFCRAGHDSIVICPPTFGMYKVTARIQGAGVIEVPLIRDRGFALDTDGVLAACRAGVKIVFLCSPNNPTGALLDPDAIERVCTELDGRAIVAVDEAYVEFARAPSFTARLTRYSNLVVLRTLSKAYALAGARCGALIAHPEIVRLLSRVITPYALPTQTIEAVLALTNADHQAQAAERIAIVLQERDKLAAA